MSDTPRTDAQEKLFFSSISGLEDPSRNYVPVDFARELERELLEAKEQARLAWERHAEKDRAYGEMIGERDKWQQMAEEFYERRAWRHKSACAARAGGKCDCKLEDLFTRYRELKDKK